MADTSFLCDLVSRLRSYSKDLMPSNPNYGKAIEGAADDLEEYLSRTVPKTVTIVDYEPCRNRETRDIITSGEESE